MLTILINKHERNEHGRHRQKTITMARGLVMDKRGCKLCPVLTIYAAGRMLQYRFKATLKKTLLLQKDGAAANQLQRNRTT
jgi:hypothetical protein